MIMKNEANNCLDTVLECHKYCIEEVVIIHNISTDDSVEICKEILLDIKFKLEIQDLIEN